MEDEKNKLPEGRERKTMSASDVYCYEQQRVIQKVIKLILDEIEDPKKGNLTSMGTIGVLEDTIKYIQNKSLMKGVRHLLNDES